MSIALSVLVPTHGRPLRLRWLLNALAEQTLERDRWEVIVSHDPDLETEAVIASAPLPVRSVQTPAPGSPGSHRNAALALARGRHVVFTDDDCYPPPGWLTAVYGAVQAQPQAIIQGPVLADPTEAAMLRSAFPHLQHFTDVPRVWAECANIAYPRDVVREVGGLVEGVLCGEDTDLCLRVRAQGIPFIGEPAMWIWHAVVDGGIRSQLRATRRWGDLVAMLERNPALRVQLWGGIFWHPGHFFLLVAGVGAGLGALHRRPTLAASALVPWAMCRPVRGGGWRGAARHLASLPGWALIEGAEMAVLARASARQRTLML